MSKTDPIEYLRNNQQRDLESLFELLRIPSVSAQPDHIDDCAAAADIIAKWLKELGFEAEVDHTPDRPAIVAKYHVSDKLPTLLVYGHYDVQPADPLELWDSDPFEPVVRNGRIYARGASDDKGQAMAWILAAQAILATTGTLPVNMKFLIEGEEETGSNSLEHYLADNAEKLKCDFAAISDTSFFNADTPAITYGLRGIYCLEAKLTGPGRDLHSGMYGGVAPNPLKAMAQLVASLYTPQGNIAVQNIYEQVTPVSDEELKIWNTLEITPQSLADEMDCKPLPESIAGNFLMRNWALPSLDCNGLWGGYNGDGIKTVIPAWAKAKLSMRLAAGQTAETAGKLLRQHLEANCPEGFKLEITDFGGEDPWLMDPASPSLQAGREAVASAFGGSCALIRCGASVPITILIRRYLGCDPVMMGFGLAEDNIHSPNENYPLSHFYRGCEAAANFIQILSNK